MSKSSKFNISYHYLQIDGNFFLFGIFEFSVKPVIVDSFKVQLVQASKCYKFKHDNGRLKKYGTKLEKVQVIELDHNMLDGKYKIPFEFEVKSQTVDNDFFQRHFFVQAQIKTPEKTYTCRREVFLYKQSDDSITKFKNSHNQSPYTISFPKQIHLNEGFIVTLKTLKPYKVSVHINQKFTFKVKGKDALAQSNRIQVFKGTSDDITVGAKALQHCHLIPSFQACNVKCTHVLDIQFKDLELSFPIELLQTKCQSSNSLNNPLLVIFNP